MAPSTAPSTSTGTTTTSTSVWANFDVNHFLAGAIAGSAGRTVVSPLERLKILYQVQGSGKAYGGTFHALGKIWREEGWRGLFRGNGANVVRIAPTTAIQFATYEKIIRIIGPNISTFDRLVAGGTAGATALFFTYPLDLARARLSLQSSSLGSGGASLSGSKSMWGTLRDVYKFEGGLRGLYKGVGFSVAGVAPYQGFNFAFYALFKRMLLDDAPDRSAVRTFICGGLAGTCSQTISYPFDVLRKKLQVAGWSQLASEHTSLLEIVRATYVREGFLGFYRGLGVNLVKVAPSMGTTFFVYEYAKRLLRSL